MIWTDTDVVSYFEQGEISIKIAVDEITSLFEPCPYGRFMSYEWSELTKRFIKRNFIEFARKNGI